MILPCQCHFASSSSSAESCNGHRCHVFDSLCSFWGGSVVLFLCFCHIWWWSSHNEVSIFVNVISESDVQAPGCSEQLMSKGFLIYYELMSEEAEPTSFVLSFRKPGEGQSIGSGVRGRGGVKEMGAKIKKLLQWSQKAEMSIVDCHRGHSIVDECRQEFGLLNKTVLHVLEQKVIFQTQYCYKTLHYWIWKTCCAVRILFFFFPSHLSHFIPN